MDENTESNGQRELLQKYLAGNCTPEEEKKVLQWFYSFEDKSDFHIAHDNANLADEMNHRLEAILFPDNKKTAVRLTLLKRVAIAASILVVLGLGIGITMKRISPTAGFELASTTNQYTKYKGEDILPGSSFANITGSNGYEYSNRDSSFLDASTIEVDQKNSVLVRVPKSGMYKVLLEDGTKVWLNSETKISFPKIFAKHERRIILSGEAYFEVAKDADRPFRIQTNDKQIEVLGTVFNVNTYGDEVKTSLIEGSVKVSNGQVSKLLKPGEEAYIGSKEIAVQPADVQLSTAWQRNEISFEGANLNEILDEIGRWYNIEIENQSDVGENIKYKGGISRLNNLSKVLEILEVATSRQFVIEGRKLIVK